EFRLPPEKRRLAIRRLKLASILLFTHLGSPTVYYGDEGAMEGLEDPFNRAYFLPEEEDRETLAHYKRLAEIRRKEPAFSSSRPVYREAKGARLSLAWRRGVGLLMNAGGGKEEFELPFDAEDLLSGRKIEKGRITLPPISALLYRKAERG
ncbi:MAG: hypothetical protein IKX85_07625, partial [Clostridia bacterium]|nr:hypothetical protein [Clostridia bacterium]